MKIKGIRILTVCLVAAGFALLTGTAYRADGGCAPQPAAAGGQFHTVIMTPGTAHKDTAKTGSQRAGGVSSGAQILPNYGEESLTLGLLCK